MPPSHKHNPHLLLALAAALAYHGSLAFYTFRRTYDAWVHIFFADHYARTWFDHWDYRWYTGFTLTSYPPGSQQSIALLSGLTGLELGFIIVQTLSILLVVVGVYRFAKIYVSEEAAGYAALLAVFASSITETIHVFGQLPTIFSLGFLLNLLPYVYGWLKEGRLKLLVVAWAVGAATTAGHHVTTLFGAIFFIGPVMTLAVVEQLQQPRSGQTPTGRIAVGRHNIFPLLIGRLHRIIPVLLRCALYGVGLIVALVTVVLPYWLWSRSDPIAQVPIPHASRDSYLENSAAGFIFWLVPYGTSLLALPYLFYKGFTTRAWPLALSIAFALLLGTGGTTPFPRMLLRGAYDILTLDRFTFWACIMSLPLLGEFAVSLRHRGLHQTIAGQLGRRMAALIPAGLVVAYLLFSIFVATLTEFRRFQPDPIDMAPIVQFLEKDDHWRWRYLTLGFGDQVAWLAAQTTATTVDGNYHSARRLPELTTTPVERLEGAKFRGIAGLGSLQQFVAVPDKYNLKFIFSNDAFYDPLLFFSGWHRLERLENGIVVWEREDIEPLPIVLPRREIPVYQRLMWGVVPMLALIVGGIMMTEPYWNLYAHRGAKYLGIAWVARQVSTEWQTLVNDGARLRFINYPRRLVSAFNEWLQRWSELPAGHTTLPTRFDIVVAGLARLRRPRFAPAPKYVRGLRTLVLTNMLSLAVLLVVASVSNTAHSPAHVVEQYYDDLDFRRLSDAYHRLDPQTRPTYALWSLERSVNNGLVLSYGKLDSVTVNIVAEERNRVVAQAETVWITALASYPTVQEHILVKRGNQWYIVADAPDLEVPPDQFLRHGAVAWYSAGRRRVTTATTNFGDVLDRPEIEILSARFVRFGDRYSVVGELVNHDVDPADLTVTAMLYDDSGTLVSRYNAQQIMMHKILPKEATPFRIDFEGVAGTSIDDTVTAGAFDPLAFSPITLPAGVKSVQLFATSVVTSRDLERDVAVQDLTISRQGARYFLNGNLFNGGTYEATIPHVIATYYDTDGRVAWVDHIYVDTAIRPQRTKPFRLEITPAAAVHQLLTIEAGTLYANGLLNSLLTNSTAESVSSSARLPLPASSGYASVSLVVNYYVAVRQ